MFQNVNSIDMQDKIFLIKKHLVKIILALIILVTLFFIIKGCVQTNYDKNKYTAFEKKLVTKMKEYATNNTFEVFEGEQTYVDLYKLNIEPSGDLKCSKSSGVLVANVNGELVYTPYLICEDYQSVLPGINNIPTGNDYITLKGLNPMIISSSYEEPGFTVADDYEVKVTGKVSNVPGLYTVNYGVYQGDVEKQSLDRVIIVGNYKGEDAVNNPYPTITLNGSSSMTINKGSTYTELGFEAYDSVDGNVKDKVEKLNSVDPNTPGEYILVYQYANTRGWLTKVTRTVTVIDTSITPLNVSVNTSNHSMTTKNVIINLSITGNNYYYTLLPNNTKTFTSNINYEVSGNGNYVFTVYDRNYNIKKETVTINNIDNKGPAAACQNKVINNKSVITVSANDSASGIAGYSYSNGTSYTSYMSNNTYTFNTGNRNAFVKVKDNLGNISYLTCSLDPSSVLNNNSTITFDMNPVTSKENLIPCGSGPQFNSALASKVNAAGIKTRWAVAQAAIYLSTDFPYKIPYFWAGKYENVGLNPEWGCDKPIPASGSERQPMGSIFPLGLDCTGFVSWAFINGGFAANIVPRYGFGERMWGNWTPVTHTFYEIAGNSQLLNSIKPGDIINGPGHAALIVGVDDTKLKVAQSSGGTNQKVNVIFVSKTTGTIIGGNYTFTNIVFMDTFFEMYGK